MRRKRKETRICWRHGEEPFPHRPHLARHCLACRARQARPEPLLRLLQRRHAFEQFICEGGADDEEEKEEEEAEQSGEEEEAEGDRMQEDGWEGHLAEGLGRSQSEEEGEEGEEEQEEEGDLSRPSGRGSPASAEEGGWGREDEEDDERSEGPSAAVSWGPDLRLRILNYIRTEGSLELGDKKAREAAVKLTNEAEVFFVALTEGDPSLSGGKVVERVSRDLVPPLKASLGRAGAVLKGPGGSSLKEAARRLLEYVCVKKQFLEWELWRPLFETPPKAAVEPSRRSSGMAVNGAKLSQETRRQWIAREVEDDFATWLRRERLAGSTAENRSTTILGAVVKVSGWVGRKGRPAKKWGFCSRGRSDLLTVTSSLQPGRCIWPQAYRNPRRR